MPNEIVLRAQTALAQSKADIAAVAPARKITNGMRMASGTALRLAAMHELITTVAHEKPQLEMELRHLEASVAIGAQQVILDYMLG